MSDGAGAPMAEERGGIERDKLADYLERLFTDVSAMIKGDLQETNSQLLLLEKVNDRVAKEYSKYGDVASGLRAFVEKLNEKSHGFDDYVSQIDAIEQQITDFEAVVSMLDNYVSQLEKKAESVCHKLSS